MRVGLALVICISLYGVVCCLQPLRIVTTRGRVQKGVVSATNPIEDRPVSFFSKKQFEELGYSKQLIEVTRSLGIDVPSKIQAISAYGVSTGKPCIIADQTGSGKTLGYLLPSIQRMLDQRKVRAESQVSPYLVVLTPTTELATQVTRVVKTLANALKFRTACFTAANDMDSEKKKLRLGADVVVSTPGRLLQLLERKEIDLSQLRVMVLDEADVLLMDESFPLQPIGQACASQQAVGSVVKRAAESGVNSDTISSDGNSSQGEYPGTQFIFVTATLPEVVVKQIHAEFPEVMTLTGPGLHRIATTVEEVLVDCSGPNAQRRTLEQTYDNKRRELLKALDSSSAQRTIVFCNTIDQCRRVENSLARDDRQASQRRVYSYHSAVDAHTRELNLRQFCRPLLREPVVLIATDRASRGMDFEKAQVDHVVLFDFPQEPSEYLRRVGRTGRAGRSGKATILVYGKQLPAAREVMKASREGKKIKPTDNL